MYVGETSRSGYQREREHLREVIMGKKTHLLVDHFEEQHKGIPHFFLMRVAKQAETAMERKIWESVHIDSLVAETPAGCLNLKSK